jgi:uncharacterized Fe-S cluster protein YjdI
LVIIKKRQKMSDQQKSKEYTNGELTVVWKPGLCIHSAKCVEALPEVYHPKEKPWIKPNNATTEALKKQISTCPSGALTYYMNDEDPSQARHTLEEGPTSTGGLVKVEVMQGGPLIVYGSIRVKGKDGQEELKANTCALCRCGASSQKPYCDGSHTDIEFDA